ncbi:Metaxin glutathione S-transferase domain [Trinorchestia longiramus]|nr:Metaxin glutathione S-transferase domain [Trinorchestia longiramus]KAF2349570.1 Metaxin glutathione S-transferase domain [Trinorchestia longiramus]
MPQVLLSESISAELGAQDPWPSDVKLFQPFEVEQILLPESAACLSVAAFLRMCKLDFKKEERANAEFMSPSGRVPFIKAGAFVVAELEHIITFVGHKTVSLTEHLDSTQTSDMRAYMSLVNNVLGSAELYVSWVHPETYNSVTAPRYSSVYPWPLGAVLTWQRRRMVLKRLQLLGWKDKTLKEVYGEVDNCCRALAERLENKPFFFGKSGTELDAVVFGHLYTLLTTPLPDSGLASVVRSYPSLVTLCRTIEGEYFKKEVASSGRFSRNEGTASGRSSRNEGDLSEARSRGAAASKTKPSEDLNESNGEYDKLEDINSGPA